ncbi:MAG: hypothetical protein CMJ19_16545 [Phycisphaeraceae bacterium]|nr:hypothetical protein [Phycisphaeraceae bacterium]
MKRFASSLVLLTLLFTYTAIKAQQIIPSDKGLVIHAGALGELTLQYPLLITNTNGTVQPNGPVKISDQQVHISYADGSGLVIVCKDGVFNFQFHDLSDDIKSIKLQMNLPIELKDGAKWDLGKNGFKDFPAQTSADPFLSRGNMRDLALRKGDDGFAMHIEHGYQQLQDNRKWNDKKFYWMASTHLPRVNGNRSYYTIKFTTLDGKTLLSPASTSDVSAVTKPASAKANTAAQVSVKLGEKGITFDLNSAGQFTLQYPKLTGLKPATPVRVNNQSALQTELEYVNGAKAILTLDDQRQIKMVFDNLQNQAKAMRVEMPVPITFAKGGKFAAGDQQGAAFPEEKQDKPFLYQGNTDKITLIHPTGPGFTLTLPKYGFQQLQDNRHWKWNTFYWWYSRSLPNDANRAEFVIQVGDLPGGAVKAKPVVDQFGQWIEADFPGKVHSMEELKADAAADEQYYASLTPPQLDPYGGIPGSGKQYNLKATGYFHLDNIKGKHILVTPRGNAFFQLGVCSLTPCDDYTRVRGREEIYQWLPSQSDPQFKSAWRPNDSGVFSFLLANRIHKTGQPFDQLEYVDMWITRERKWGFNSLGAFCPVGGKVNDVLAKHNYPFVGHLPLGNLKMVPDAHLIWDPFVPGIEQEMDRRMAKYASEFANDPLLIGSFITNEPHIEEIPKAVPILKASESAAKARLVQLLKERYPNVADFAKAWNIKADRYEQVGQMPLNITTKQASEDMQDYFALFLDRRYKLVHDAFRKHMPNHLLIGDRWMPGTSNNELLIATAAKYLDIISINYYAVGFDRDYLDRMHRWSGGKPILLSEFYYTSPAESGLPGGRGLASQDKRGKAYRNYVESALDTGYVVGIEWFINVDQAVTGRFFQGFNGEANNTGLVSVADRPYKDMLKHMMDTNYDWFSVFNGSRKPYQIDDPSFHLAKGGSKKTVTIDRMTLPFKLDGKRSEWPLTPPYRIARPGAKAEASFRMAWDMDNLYLYAEVFDETPMINTQDAGSIWNGDALELFIGIEEFDRVGNMIYSDRQVILRGAPAEPGKNKAWIANIPKQLPVDTMVIPNINSKGYTIEAVIPFASLNIVPKSDQQLLFDMALDNRITDRGGRHEQILYNGNQHASRNRGVWGRAILVD